jgi:hypothetical protein
MGRGGALASISSMVVRDLREKRGVYRDFGLKSPIFASAMSSCVPNVTEVAPGLWTGLFGSVDFSSPAPFPKRTARRNAERKRSATFRRIFHNLLFFSCFSPISVSYYCESHWTSPVRPTCEREDAALQTAAKRVRRRPFSRPSVSHGVRSRLKKPGFSDVIPGSLSLES